MLKLYIYIHTHTYTLCFCSKLVKYDIVVDGMLMNSHSIDDVVVMRCCCWWLKPWVIIIIELWCEIVWFWKFYKNGSNCDLWWNDVLVQVLYGFECLFHVYKRLDKHWKQIWALGIQNWDFGVKIEFYSRANCHSSPWRANWWPWRVMKCPACHGEWFGGHGELLSTTTHVFVVLWFWGSIWVF